MKRGSGFKIFIIVFVSSLFAFILLVLFPRNKNKDSSQNVIFSEKIPKEDISKSDKKDTTNVKLKEKEFKEEDTKDEGNKYEKKPEEKKPENNKTELLLKKQSSKLKEHNNNLQSLNSREDRIKYFEKNILPTIADLSSSSEAKLFFENLKYDINAQIRSTDKGNTAQIELLKSYLEKINNYE